jgi:uncharacterized membrane protein SirB2
MVYVGALHAHLLFVFLSVTLFVLRGVGVAWHASWPMDKKVRWASVGIDMALMAAGLTLWITASHNPMQEPWLATKFALLLVYIVLGSMGLKRGRTPRARLVYFVAALCVVSQMVCIALTRDPSGVWAVLVPMDG